MSKYTEELKKQIVLEHKIKHYGARVLQRKYGIPRSLIRQWIAQYELNGKFTEPTRTTASMFPTAGRDASGFQVSTAQRARPW